MLNILWLLVSPLFTPSLPYYLYNLHWLVSLSLYLSPSCFLLSLSLLLPLSLTSVFKPPYCLFLSGCLFLSLSLSLLFSTLFVPVASSLSYFRLLNLPSTYLPLLSLSLPLPPFFLASLSSVFTFCCCSPHLAAPFCPSLAPTDPCLLPDLSLEAREERNLPGRSDLRQWRRLRSPRSLRSMLRKCGCLR